MITRIIVGRGNKRTVIDLPRDREERIALGNKIKGLRLFPERSAFLDARERGLKALAANRRGTGRFHKFTQSAR